MSGIETRNSFPKLLWPGVNAIWGETYVLWDKGAEWRNIYSVNSSDKEYEEDVSVTPYGNVPIKNESDAITYDTRKQAYISRYTNVTRALGYIVSEEELEDGQYPQVIAARTRNLAQSFYRTQEIVGANVLNRAFNASYPGGDTVSLINASHPIEGGIMSNTLTNPADLSEASLEQAAIDIAGFVNNRGDIIAAMPNRLITPRQLQYEAQRILKNPNRPETADRDINALYQLNTFPGGAHLNHYLSDPDAWFIITDCMDGMKYFERQSTSFADDNDFDTTNLKYRGRCRYSYGWSDFRAAFGSPGA